MRNNHKKAIALEARLSQCEYVTTLGVRPNFSDYSEKERALIRDAAKIFYPSAFYAELFDTIGKATFPSYHTYKYVQDKVKQTALFQLLDLPHPRTRVFYGKRQKKKITNFFRFPFIGKVARGSAMGRGVYLIRNQQELDSYCALNHVAYIQEYLSVDRDMRVVVIGNDIVHAYWRIAPQGEFRTNVAQGGTVSLADVPEIALNLALKTARACCWNDVGIDICRFDGNYYILEANMKYGKEGFRQAGIDYYQLMNRLIANEEI